MRSSEECQRCHGKPGKGRRNASLIEAHHNDYSKPLEVVWLCRDCHRLIHRDENGGTFYPERGRK